MQGVLDIVVKSYRSRGNETFTRNVTFLKIIQNNLEMKRDHELYIRTPSSPIPIPEKITVCDGLGDQIR